MSELRLAAQVEWWYGGQLGSPRVAVTLNGYPVADLPIQLQPGEDQDEQCARVVADWLAERLAN